MTINQLSIFIENKSGTLVKVLQLLKGAGIQLIASTIADTLDYGIFRIICNEPKRAYLVLQEAGVAVTLSDVFAIALENRPGCASDVIAEFASEGVQISYLYSFLLGGKGILIFRSPDNEKVEEIIRCKGLKGISEESLKEN